MPPQVRTGPQRYEFDPHADPSPKMEANRKAIAKEARIQNGINNPLPQNTPGSGQMTPNSLARPPAWEGQLNQRGIDPHTSPQGATPSGAPLGGNSAGQSGIGTAAPPVDPGWQLKGTGHEGVVLPDTGYNYKGEKSYVDPFAAAQGGSGRVLEIDPSKDQRFSVNGQTSGAQTAQGIQDKYQVPGTTAAFTPGSIAPTSGTIMGQNGQVTQPPQTPERQALFQAHPEIFQTGTPQNAAFVAHANQFGEASAHQNIDSIMQGAQQPSPTPSPSSTPPTEATAPQTIATTPPANKPAAQTPRKQVDPFSTEG